MEETESNETPVLTTSVLIVSHNCEPALRRCLRALESSEHRETFEVLVVDCGSHDGSGQVDEEFSAVTVLRLPRNFGRTKARNIGARTAKGTYLLLLEPDVIVQPETVPRLSEAIAKDPAVVAVCPRLVDSDGAMVSLGGPLPDPDALCRAWSAGQGWETTLNVVGPIEEPLAVECCDPGAVMIKTQTIRGMNFFDERYGEFGSDLDLCTQAYKANKRIVILPDVTAVVRRGEDLWTPPDSGAETALAADYGNGIIAYTEKHYGFFPAIKVRLRLWLRSLLSLRLGLLNRLLSGQTIDGSQTAM